MQGGEKSLSEAYWALTRSRHGALIVRVAPKQSDTANTDLYALLAMIYIPYFFTQISSNLVQIYYNKNSVHKA